MLEVKKLNRQFQSEDNKVTAVRDVTLEVADGTFAAIVGKSGSGKSTLLSLIGALDRPDSGEIIVDGQDITKLNDGRLTKYRCQKIGFIFQGYNLIPNLTALENVMLPMEMAHVKAGERKERAIKLLEEVGLSSDKHNRLPSRLSGGEQQRVAIARALANKPSLILADEPTGNLDSQTGTKIFDLLHSLSRKEKTTIIVVTHDLSIAGRTDQIFRITDGALSAVTSKK
jgi:putative ABC transport system ATP-binding protein